MKKPKQKCANSAKIGPAHTSLCRKKCGFDKELKKWSEAYLEDRKKQIHPGVLLTKRSGKTSQNFHSSIGPNPPKIAGHISRALPPNTPMSLRKGAIWQLREPLLPTCASEIPPNAYGGWSHISMGDEVITGVTFTFTCLPCPDCCRYSCRMEILGNCHYHTPTVAGWKCQGPKVSTPGNMQTR